MSDENQRHKDKMQKLQGAVHAAMDRAQTQRGVMVFLTGNGKGKTSSAFGMVMRSLGYGHRVGVVQFIKGQQLSGEEIYLRERHPDLPFYQMGTGFTWDTQDRAADIAAAEKTWMFAETLLQDASLDLVVLDELTYMLGFGYLDEARVLAALRARPLYQSVVVTGRGGGSALRDSADTVSEIEDVKHAFAAGVQARAGVDF